MSIAHYKNIKIIGTSHIASQSIKDIDEYVVLHLPDIVAVELDKGRLHSLFSKTKEKKGLPPISMIKRIGLVGYLFLIMGSFFQKRLGKIVRIEPGADMKQAVMSAKDHDLKVALIDQNIEKTLAKLSKSFTFKEFLKIIKEVFLAMFNRNKKVKNVNFDLKKVPDDKTIEMMIEMIKGIYPSFYNVLIDDRNKIMARKLILLSKKYPEKEILAVVGAGHKKGMLEYLKKYEHKLEIIEKKPRVN